MANSIGMTSPRVKHGYVYGPRLIVGPVPVGASEVFSNQGGHFCWLDTSRRIEIAGSGNNPDAGAYIAGWAECGAFTASSIEGGSSLPLDVSCFSVYAVLADDTLTAAMRLKVCDLITASNIQKIDVGEANEDYMVIVDVDIANTIAYVRINETAQYKTNIV